MENNHEEKTVRPHVEIPKSILEEFKQKAKSEGKTVNELINEYVISRLDTTKPDVTIPTIFWCGKYEGIQGCCYNHFIGLPVKDGIRHPIYPYEERLYESLNNHKLISIIKATGLGITEFLLRYAEFKCLTEYQDAQVVIIVGPNLDSAKTQIKRINEHLHDKIGFQSTDYEIRLPKGNLIKAFPSMNINAARSLKNPKLILVDEAAFFGMRDDIEARAVAERYQAKSDAQIVIYSTPGLPEGMFYDLIKEENSQYEKIELHYQEGLIPHPIKPELTIYDRLKIEEAKLSHSFGREYELQWGYGYGDVYTMEEISKCVKVYPLVTIPSTFVEMDVDPGYGSSKFAILIWQKIGPKMQILYTQELERPSQTEALNIIRSLIPQWNVKTLRIDSSRPDLITEFSNEINTISQNFRSTGLDMLGISSKLVKSERIEIHPRFEKLLQQMRAAKRDTKNGDLDKKIMSFDLLDCLRMASWGFEKGSGYGVIATPGELEEDIPSMPEETQIITRIIDLSVPPIGRKRTKIPLSLDDDW